MTTRRTKTTTGVVVGSPSRRLTAEERERIVQLRVRGESVSQIARELMCSREAVTHALASPQAIEIMVDCRAELRKHRERFVALWLEAAEHAAKMGRHLPAMHALLSLKEVDHPNPPPVVPQQAVVVSFGGMSLPGLPAPPGPAFTVPSTMPALPSVTQRDLTSIE